MTVMTPEKAADEQSALKGLCLKRANTIYAGGMAKGLSKKLNKFKKQQILII